MTANHSAAKADNTTASTETMGVSLAQLGAKAVPLAAIFDAPHPPPTPDRPFLPFPESYITGPVPAQFKELTVTDLAARLFRVTPSEGAALVDFGAVWLDDRPCFLPHHSLAEHKTFRLNPPVYGPVKFYEADPGRIAYEDRDLLIYNKESGRPSQAVPHDGYNNALSACGRLLASRGEGSDLWLLHRLDADTSGLLMMAKNKNAASFLGKAFQEGQVAKEYLCLGLGPAPEKDQFEIDAPIAKEGGKYVVKPKGPGLQAKTLFTAPGYKKPFTGEGSTKGWHEVLFLAQPLTGRTHQIRLHLAWAGWPILGDRFYGRPEGNLPHLGARLMLASAGIIFNHPRTGEKTAVRLPGIFH